MVGKLDGIVERRSNVIGRIGRCRKWLGFILHSKAIGLVGEITNRRNKMSISARQMIMQSVNSIGIHVRRFNLENITDMVKWIHQAWIDDLEVKVKSVLIVGVIHTSVLIEGECVAVGRTAYA